MSQEDRLTGLVGYSGMKVPVIAATTAAITLSGEQTIDGIACVTDDRVLVKDQASAVNNGIYVVDTGSWTRAPDADGPYDFVFGTLTPVASGSVNGGAVFRLTTTGTITPGTSSLSFSTMGLLSTPVPIASGGTGAITAALARAGLDVPSNAEAILKTISTTRGDLIRGGVGGVPERVALGASGTVLKSDGTDAAWSTDAASTSAAGRVELLTQAEYDAGTDTTRAPTASLNRIVLGTQQATTSGTAIDFTGIPAGTRLIRILFKRVSTNSTSNFLIQIGDAGGIETSGYLSAAQAGATAVGSTAGFIATQNVAAAGSYSGVMELALENSATFSWCARGQIGRVDATVDSQTSQGDKDLSAELTQLRVTTVSGDTFDAGAINIQYER